MNANKAHAGKAGGKTSNIVWQYRALPGHARPRRARRQGVRQLAGRARHAARASTRADSAQQRATPSSVQGLTPPLVRLRQGLADHEASVLVLATQKHDRWRRRSGTACACRACRTPPGEGGGGQRSGRRPAGRNPRHADLKRLRLRLCDPDLGSRPTGSNRIVPASSRQRHEPQLPMVSPQERLRGLARRVSQRAIRGLVDLQRLSERATPRPRYPRSSPPSCP